MKYIVDILKQFTQPQRLVVLVVILGAIILTQYLRTDDCRAIIDENLKMHQDFVTLSEMVRENRMRNLESSSSSSSSTSYSGLDTIVIVDDVELEMLEIIESNIK